MYSYTHWKQHIGYTGRTDVRFYICEQYQACIKYQKTPVETTMIIF